MKTYSVSKVKQLIDLNGDSVNFELKFSVRSHDNAPFDVLVVDQTTLDNNSELKYKNITNGFISGKLRHNKNTYENHFLILKADSPCECDVEIEKNELPIQEEINLTENNPENSSQNSSQNSSAFPPTRSIPPNGSPVGTSKLNADKNDSFHWIKIILGVGLIAGVGFAIYFISQKYEKAVLYTPPRIINSPVKIISPPKISLPNVTAPKVSAPNLTAPKVSAPSRPKTLVDRLNGLDID